MKILIESQIVAIVRVNAGSENPTNYSYFLLTTATFKVEGGKLVCCLVKAFILLWATAIAVFRD
jgi:hypothetical protein